MINNTVVLTGMNSNQSRVFSSFQATSLSARTRRTPVCRAEGSDAPQSYLARINPSSESEKGKAVKSKAVLIDMTKPEWWRQVDDWQAFFNDDRYVMDDGFLDDYALLGEDTSEDAPAVVYRRPVNPQFNLEKGTNPSALRAKGVMVDEVNEMTSQEAADKELEADFDAEDAVDSDDEEDKFDEALYRHAVVKMIQDKQVFGMDPNFQSLMKPEARKEIMFGDQRDSVLDTPFKKDKDPSDWDLKAKMEKRKRLTAEKAEFDRRRSKIGTFPIQFVGPEDIRLKNSPNYEEMFGKTWSHEEIMNLINMDGAAGDLSKVQHRVCKVMDPEVVYDYPGTFGYEYVMETEEFLTKTGHWMKAGAVSTDAEVTLLSSEFKELDALNALNASKGRPKGAAIGSELPQLDDGEDELQI